MLACTRRKAWIHREEVGAGRNLRLFSHLAMAQVPLQAGRVVLGLGVKSGLQGHGESLPQLHVHCSWLFLWPSLAALVELCIKKSAFTPEAKSKAHGVSQEGFAQLGTSSFPWSKGPAGSPESPPEATIQRAESSWGSSERGFSFS